MKTIGMFLGTTEDSYGQELLEGAYAACRARGVRLLCVSSGTLQSSHGMEAQRNVLYDVVQATSLDGVIISGTLSHNVSQAVLEGFCSRFSKLPLASIAIKLPGFHGIITDPHESMVDLVKHLVEHHQLQNIAFLGGPPGQQESEERKSVVLQTLAELGFPMDPRLIIHGDFTYESGKLATQTLFAQQVPFNAIISANDSMALGAMEVINALGKKVPYDIAITGFDDVIDGRFHRPSLTTIRQSVVQQGYLAAMAVVDMIGGKQLPPLTKVPTDLLIRGSCGCPPTWLRIPCSPMETGCVDPWHKKSDQDLPESNLRAAQVIETWDQILEPSSTLVAHFLEAVFLWSESIDPEVMDPTTAWQDLQEQLRQESKPWKTDILLQAGFQVLDAFVKRSLRVQVGINNLGDKIRGVREALLATFNLPDVLNVLTSELSNIGYRGAWLSLFTDQKNPTGTAQICLALESPPQSGPDAIPISRTIPEKAPTFPSWQLLPGGLESLGEESPLLVLEALYSREVHLGFMLFDTNYLLSQYTGTLRTQISGAIHGSLLLEQKDRAVDQLVDAEKSVALGNLVAGIAHEVNTPLGVALTAASFLTSKQKELAGLYQAGTMKRSDLEEWLTLAGESSAIISTNLDRAARLITSFKKVSSDQASEIRRTFAVVDYLGEILTSLKPHMKRHQGITIGIHGDPELTMDSYPGALSQIISNLVINAFAHAFDPGQKGQCTLGVAKRDTMIILSFTDTGKGITPENLPHIFEPFFTTKRGQGGTGLGLHIIQNLTEKVLGGHINCTSTLGYGTTFTLTIPQISPEKPR